ncbi:MAG: integrase, partial [Chloroflexota bacterium]
MFGSWLASIKRIGAAILQKVQNWLKAKTKPATCSQALETASDLLRSKSELVAENALLRQQLIVL